MRELTQHCVRVELTDVCQFNIGGSFPYQTVPLEQIYSMDSSSLRVRIVVFISPRCDCMQTYLNWRLLLKRWHLIGFGDSSVSSAASVVGV